MPSLQHASAKIIDKHGPSRLQQLAGPMYVKVPPSVQHYSSRTAGQTSMLLGTYLQRNSARRPLTTNYHLFKSGMGGKSKQGSRAGVLSPAIKTMLLQPMSNKREKQRMISLELCESSLSSIEKTPLEKLSYYTTSRLGGISLLIAAHPSI